HEGTILFHYIVGQYRDARATLHRKLYGRDAVDLQGSRSLRSFRSSSSFQPVHVGQMRRDRLTKDHQPVPVQVSYRTRFAVAADIGWCHIKVEVDREHLALDEVRLLRLAHADRAVGLPHGQVEFIVIEDEL